MWLATECASSNKINMYSVLQTQTEFSTHLQFWLLEVQSLLKLFMLSIQFLKRFPNCTLLRSKACSYSWNLRPKHNFVLRVEKIKNWWKSWGFQEKIQNETKVSIIKITSLVFKKLIKLDLLQTSLSYYSIDFTHSNISGLIFVFLEGKERNISDSIILAISLILRWIFFFLLRSLNI